MISPQMNAAAAKAGRVAISQAMRDRVDALVKDMQSPQWKARMAQGQAAVRQTLGLDDGEAPTPGEGDQDAPTGRLVVFISRSVPLETLRHYARDLERVPGAVMVLRGFVGEPTRLAPTARFIAAILRKDKHCEGPRCALRNLEIQVDPYVFRKYQVTRVPAVVFEAHVNPQGYCALDLEALKADPSTRVIVGDAALGYAVDLLVRETGHAGLRTIQQALEPR